jgi:hypothetical protein
VFCFEQSLSYEAAAQCQTTLLVQELGKIGDAKAFPEQHIFDYGMKVSGHLDFPVSQYQDQLARVLVDAEVVGAVGSHAKGGEIRHRAESGKLL